MKIKLTSKRLEKARPGLVKVAVVVNGRHGQYNSHRWKSAGEALKILKENMKSKGVKNPEDIKYKDKKTGKVIGDKELIEAYNQKGGEDTLQEFVSQNYTATKADGEGNKAKGKAKTPKSEPKKEPVKEDTPLKEEAETKRRDQLVKELAEMKENILSPGEAFKEPLIEFLTRKDTMIKNRDFENGEFSMTYSKRRPVYVATISGTHPKFRLDRDFDDPIKDDGGIKTYALKEGILYNWKDGYEQYYGMVIDGKLRYTDQKRVVENLVGTGEYQREIAKNNEKAISLYAKLDTKLQMLEGQLQGKANMGEDQQQLLKKINATKMLQKQVSKLSGAIFDILPDKLKNEDEEAAFNPDILEQLANIHGDPTQEEERTQNVKDEQADWQFNLQAPLTVDVLGKTIETDPLRAHIFESNRKMLVLQFNDLLEQLRESGDYGKLTETLMFRNMILDTAKTVEDLKDGKLRNFVNSKEKGYDFQSALEYSMGKWPLQTQQLLKSNSIGELNNLTGGTEIVPASRIRWKSHKKQFDPLEGLEPIQYKGEYTKAKNHREFVEKLALLKDTPLQNFGRANLDMLGIVSPLYVKKGPWVTERSYILGMCIKTKGGDVKAVAASERGSQLGDQATMIHESMHALIKGGVSRETEEVIVESCANYGIDTLYGSEGRRKTPSYIGSIISALPQLKGMKEFSHCNSLNDFGEVMMEKVIAQDTEFLSVIEKTLNKKVGSKIQSQLSKRYDEKLASEENRDTVIDQYGFTMEKMNKERLGDHVEEANNTLDDFINKLKSGIITLEQAITQSGAYADMAALLIFLMMEEEDILGLDALRI